MFPAQVSFESQKYDVLVSARFICRKQFICLKHFGATLKGMLLTPSDQDKLLLQVAGIVARDRRQRGLLLNYPESVALLSCWIIERAREGALVADLMRDGRTVLSRAEVMAGVPEMIPDLQMEATFPDGRKLVTLTEPII
ncbi:hypothetical protein GCM10009569_01160 [Arthrobacter russicus]